MMVGDFNGDGKTDIVGRDTAGIWWVGTSTGSSFSTSSWGSWSTTQTWQNVMAGDFNGDGLTDIAGRDNGGNWWVGLSTGSSFVTTLWGNFSTQVTWTDMHANNFGQFGPVVLPGGGRSTMPLGTFASLNQVAPANGTNSRFSSDQLQGLTSISHDSESWQGNSSYGDNQKQTKTNWTNSVFFRVFPSGNISKDLSDQLAIEIAIKLSAEPQKLI
jgi:hypothetical protein